MSICCNLNCDKVTLSKAKRCGPCRWHKKYTCAICGDTVNNVQKIFCIDCAEMSKLAWSLEYHKNYKQDRRDYHRVYYITRKHSNNTIKNI